MNDVTPQVFQGFNLAAYAVPGSVEHDVAKPAVISQSRFKRRFTFSTLLAVGASLFCRATLGMVSVASAYAQTNGEVIGTPPAGFSSHFAEANGLKLHYVEGGSGPVVILLHGWPATWWVWRKVMPLLAPHYRVIAIDMPGLGDSSGPPKGYDKKSLAGGIHSVLATLDQKRVALVGHDLGAAVAYAYAKQFPGEVDKLVVMDDAIPGLKDWDDVKGKWPRWHFAFHSIPDLPEALVAGREYTYLSWFYHNAYQKGAITEADARLYAWAYAKPASLHAGFEYYRAFDQDAADNESDSSQLAMPVLALGGDHSPWKSYLGEQLEGRAPSLQAEVVPDCGHFIPEERPEWLAECLRRFLN